MSGNVKNISDALKALTDSSYTSLKSRDMLEGYADKFEGSQKIIKCEQNAVKDKQKSIYEYADILDDLSDCLNHHVVTLNEIVLVNLMPYNSFLVLLKVSFTLFFLILFL